MFSVRAGRLSVVIAAALVGGAVAAAPAHAALVTGSWQSPTQGQTVSGTVALRFASQQSAVTFQLPGGNQNATVSGGVATASWVTTAVANGSYSIGAVECDITGCSTTSETVTVANTPPPAPKPLTFAPASGSRVSPGDVITVSGGTTATITVARTYAGMTGAGPAMQETLPWSYTVQAGDAGQQLRIADSDTDSVAYYEVVGKPKILATSAAKAWFPHKDGYLDNFTVTLVADQQVGANLYLKRNGKVVARASKTTTAVTSSDGSEAYVVTLSAGAGLKAGRYSWNATVTDGNDVTTSTKTKTVTADGRKASWVTKSATFDASQVVFTDVSQCGSAKKSGGTVVFTSQSSCSKQGGSVGAAVFFPSFPSSSQYRPLSLSVTATSVEGIVVVFLGGTDSELASTQLKAGTVSLKVPGYALSLKHQQLQFLIGTGGGASVTITKLGFRYQVAELHK